ncbi:serine hydrolase [Enterocloster citroniae]|uniref:serine hydrolase n=1 Tax=Enterocloster citroniae TaxID=358743 RepID=UPI00189B0DC5|nr:serine hydrolase [Enterocloster citroniae]
MRLKQWKSFLCICTSCALLMSTAVYANPVVIAPLEESQVASVQSGGQSGSPASNQGPSGSGDAGTVSSSGPAADNTAGQPSSGASPTEAGNGISPGAPGTGSQGNTGNNTTGNNVTGNIGTVDTSAIQQPVVAAEGAVLMDAATGNVLFSKNGETKYYPASITKLMTALLVAENCGLDDKVTFSATATTNLESGAVSINMTEGDVMTVRQCLYALLLKSANEVGNALAEHVAGSNAQFAEKMNAKAAALGCTNTHFTNPHGLNDSNHYTTPHDMALIARAAFQNDIVKTVASTRTYSLPATIKNPSGLTVSIGHKMLNPSDSRYYEGVIGGKTGYTSKAGNTLVTAAEKDGVRLIAVVMKAKSTHYTDTKSMFDYGFELAKAGALGSSNSSGTGPSSTGNAGNGTVGNSSTGTNNTATNNTGTNSTGNSGPGTAAGQGWVQDATGWYYVKDNGSKAVNEWLTLDGVSYWIDSNSYMAKGWRQINGIWYFLRSNGAMAKNQWEKVDENGLWFYLGPDGAMLTNTTTPDGHYVGSDGAWVE